MNGKHDFRESAFTDEGVLINSGEFDNLNSADAKEKISEFLQANKLGQPKINYRLRDWGVSRQRYWGAPIPMITCEDCGIIPVAEEDLPVVLPENVDLSQSGSPLQNCPEFINTICPRCEKDAVRESDTFDTFFESSWYYARFACKGQENAMLDDRAKYWTPVDQYIGGIEHAVMHLLYARFFHKLMRDEGLVNSDEPFKSLLSQGMVLKDGAKMSKSVGNIVDPNALIDKYGADTARLFVMFAAPPEQSLEWSDAGVDGSYRFLNRVWNYCEQNHDLIIEVNEALMDTNIAIDWQNCDSILKKARHNIHQILQQISNDYDRHQFNTVVSGCMKLFNEISAYKVQTEDDKYLVHSGVSFLLRCLAPITPHICHVLWQELGFTKAIIDAPWPKVDKSALKTDEVNFVVQVNGKLRAEFSGNPNLDNAELIELAKKYATSFIDGKEVVKSIIVAHRHLINLVVK